MPAYNCQSDCGEGEEIRFYADAAEAGKYCGDENPPRAPEFDQYESLGYVPTEALIANGWYLYCDHCARRSDDEEDDDHEGQQVEHVFRGQFYFCHPDCERSWQAARDRVKAAHDRFRNLLASKYPELILNDVSGDPGHLLYADVRFPGGEGCITESATDRKILIWTADAPAWKAFVADCQSEQ